MEHMKAQLNIRNNVRDMQAYVKDLYSWEEEIKTKDEMIRKGKHQAPKRAGEPAVRGQAPASVAKPRPELMVPAAQLCQGAPLAPSAPASSVKKRRKKRPAAPASGAGSAAGHTYDYFRDKWDKFDVDAALAEADAASEYETDTDEEQAALTESATRRAPATTCSAAAVPAVRQPRTPEEDAAFWKAKGNDYFKFGDFAKASECYSSSLAAMRTAASFANRGLACLKLRDWPGAVQDCTEALAMDPAYVKAFQRRATARRELGDLEGCLEDLDAALRLLPASTAISGDLQAALRTYAATHGLVMPSGHVTLRTCVLTPPTATARRDHSECCSPHERGASQLSSFEHLDSTSALVQAVDNSTASSLCITPPEQSVAMPLEAAAEHAGPEQPGPGPAASLPTASAGSPANAARQLTSAPAAPRFTSPSDMGVGVAALAPPSHVPAPRPYAQAAPITPSTGASPSPLSSAASAPVSASPALPARQPTAPATEPPRAQPPLAAAMTGTASTSAPSTSTEFEVSWRACRGDGERERALLRAVRPEALPAIFKSSLTPSVLAGVARAALEGCSSAESRHAEEGSAEHGVAVLRELARVDRFAINAMLVTGPAKAALKSAWDAVDREQGNVAAELAALRPAYRV